MNTDTVALLGGLLFLLLALVGGGFTVREIIMPTVPGWGRVACLVVGVALVVPFFISAVQGDSTPTTDAGVFEPVIAPAPGGDTTLYSDGESYVSGDGIEVSGLIATGKNDEPVVGDRIKIQFTLENVGSAPVTFDYTFVAARSPGDKNEDFGEENQGRVLTPGEVLDLNHSILLDAPGTWTFFPCYLLQGGTYCPDEWRSFDVLVK